MNYYKYEEIKSINFELTSKCALKCSRCARITDRGNFKQVDLPLEIIKKRIPTSIFKKGFLADLSGNYGDPIYHADFVEILRYLKSFDIDIYIETNGSGRSKEWWEEVVSVLGPYDIVSFSIDGLEDTNHLYRENARWDDIMTALKVCSGRVKTFWKYIVFKHNEHQLEEAQSLANELGVNKFKLVKSSLFYYHFGEEDDPLMPSLEYIQSSLAKKIRIRRGEHENEPKPKGTSLDEMGMNPKCITSQRHYISSEGFYTPCCWISIFSDDNDFNIQKRPEFNLYHHNLQEIIEGEAMNNLARSWDKVCTSPKFCQKKCQEAVIAHTSHDFVSIKV